MKLKKLEILGFKSFAEKTKLEFDFGITAIVGPNGCGKSNIADAFRWVLGEQSAKSMRGGKMPDVIFAGTAHRKPLNFAEVTITLSDIEGSLPIAYEEISLTRRLHRSGESDYFINRQPVRLKDVQNIFLDSGMGKDAYAVFEQGKIDQIIQFTPLERRPIFEEAAGILRFLQRKKEALRKLEQTELNVARANDIYLEVEKQIIVLEAQAEKARLFKQTRHELENLEKRIIVAKWKNLHKRREDSSKKETELQSKIQGAQKQIDEWRYHLHEAKTLLTQGEQAWRKKSEEVFKIRSEKEIQTKEKESNGERFKEALLKEKRWQQDLDALLTRRAARQIEVQAALKQQSETERDLARFENESRIQREKVNGIENETSKLKGVLTVRQQEFLSHMRLENQLDSEVKQNTLRLENFQERQKVLRNSQKQLENSLQDMTVKIEEQKILVFDSSQSIDSQKESLLASDKCLRNLAEEIQKCQGELESLQLELSDSKARQKILLRLREDREGFSLASKALLQEASNEKSPLFQKIKGLYEFLIPKKGAEAALAAAMRPYAQTLVVQSKEDYDEVLAFAEKHKLKDFSLLCVGYLAKQLPESSDFPSLRNEVEEHPLSHYFLNKVFLVEKDPISYLKKEIAGEFCTSDGIVIDHRRVIFFNSQGEKNVFVREAELKLLEERLPQLEMAKQEMQNALKSLQTKRSQIQTERTELDKLIRVAEMKHIEVNFGLQKLQGDFEKARKDTQRLAQEYQEIDLSLETIRKALADAQQKYAAAKAKTIDLNGQITTTNQEFDERSLSLKKELSVLQDRETACRKASDEHSKILHSLHVFEVKDLESQQQEKRLQDEIEASQVVRSHIKMKEEEFLGALHDVEKTLINATAAYAELEQDLAAKKSSIAHIESKIAEKQQELKKLEIEHSQFAMQQSQFQNSCQALENELHESYHLSLSEVLDWELEKSLDHTERQIRMLKQQIESFGDINMTSIEECEKHKSRYSFLQQQIQDLKESQQELMQIIAQLDEESRKVFKSTFEAITVNFKKNFQILFNGGEADLQFTDTREILEAGIEIIAKPPGKQMRSINLLSGGEKCLTAMALLFAIFEVKPSPFCILDEIDAPLDDTNVERFVHLLKDFVDRCQFIIITHNKRTMAIADVLFGISMEEKGVSKILSMQFTKNEVYTPALVS